MRTPLLLATLLLCLGGCGGGASTATDGGPDGPGAAPDLAPSNDLVRARPYDYDVPMGYDPTKPTPLVILLHGYSASGYVQRAYFFGTSGAVDEHGFILAYPDGTIDSSGNRFWNATDACCDFGHTGVDDVAYLDAIVADMHAHFNIDDKRVYVIGHSNGGFMSHRYACDRAHTVAAIMALAGDDWKDATKCAPSEPVAVLQVHGDMDQSVPYAGNALDPSAHDSVAGWAQKNGCVASPTDTSAPPIDLVKSLPGAETTLERWTGCKPGGDAELWTMHGAPHVPDFNQPAWPETIWQYLAAHPKP